MADRQNASSSVDTRQQGASAGASTGTQSSTTAASSTAATQGRAQEQGTRSREQEQRLPVGRDVPQRGSALSRQRTSLLPAMFSAPPGMLTSAFMSDPFSFMRQMSEEMGRMFDAGMMTTSPMYSRSDDQANVATWMPQVEIHQTGKEFLVRADLPGLNKDDVDVEVDDGVLRLSGERRQEARDEGEGYYRSERSYGSFYRAIPLPEGVNEDAISASFKDGVLEVRAPVPAQQQPRARKLTIK